MPNAGQKRGSVLAELANNGRERWPTFGAQKQAARPRLNKINRHLSATSVGKT